MIAAISYVRVSTTKQKEYGYSLTAQQAKLDQYAKQNNYNLVTKFSDAGRSGKNMKRAGLIEVLSLVKHEKIKALLVWRLNRLSRNVNELLKIFRICDDHNVAIVSLNEPTEGESATGKLQRNIFAIVAELERQIIADNQSIAYKQKMKEGKLISSQIPYGYKWDHKKIVTNESASAVVKLIFDCYTQQKMGYRKIGGELESKGLGHWSEARLKNLITNQRYTGIVSNSYGHLMDVIPAIISEEQYQLAQKIRLSRHQQSQPQKFLFRGELICPYCQRHLSMQQIKHGRQPVYYYCTGNHRPSFSVAANNCDNNIIERLFNVLTEPQIWKKLQRSKSTYKKEELHQQYELRRKKAALVAKYEDSIISAAQLKQQLIELSSVKTIRTNVVPLANAKKAYGLLNHATKKQQLIIAQHLIERVTFDTKKNISAMYLKIAPELNILCLKKGIDGDVVTSNR